MSSFARTSAAASANARAGLGAPPGSVLRVAEGEQLLAALPVGPARLGGEGRLVVGGRLRVGQRTKRFARSGELPVDEPLGGHQRPRVAQVSSDLTRPDPAPSAVPAGEMLCDLQVQSGAPRGRQGADDRLGDERVLEGVTARWGGRHEPGLGGLIERFEQLEWIARRGARQRVEVELKAEDRGQRERGVRARAQAPEPPRHHVAHPGRRSLDVLAALLLVAQQLVEEEGVAAGAPAVAAGGFGVGVGGATGQHCGDRVVVEAGQRDVHQGALPAQVRDDLRNLSRQFRLADAQEHQRPRTQGVARDVTQERQGVLIGPVQVVEDQQQRPVLGGPLQQGAHRLKGEVALREWLEQQAAAGILACENPDAAPDQRRFALPAGHDAALLDPGEPGQRHRLRARRDRLPDAARAYPLTHVDGIDEDSASIEAARRNAAEAGLAERVRFFRHDAADDGLGGAYDLVTICEALHDMARPVEALRAARRLLADGGCVIVADERVGERFTAPTEDPVERFCYAASVLHCLPVGRADEHSAATGTVMRPPTLRAYAEQAGFTHVEVLPIENDLWRFYRLNP